ncbi:MAG: ArnT family glycosyltransferase [Bryobacteraceae bacterium]
MILDREIELPVANELPSPRRNGTRWKQPLRRDIPVWLGLLAVVVCLQILSGAYRAEFSGYPDEPAHYVTAVMLRDYVVHLHFLESPLRFASEYYHHYPKVAFGHWPPFFYIVQAIWMALFSAARTSVRLQIACTTALLGFGVFREAKKLVSAPLAIAGALLTICLPLVQTYSAEEMSETLLTLLCFWSVIYFARYIRTENVRHSLLFASFLSLAVLTKGNGWLLAAVPPIALLLTRRLHLLLRKSFWVPVLLIAAVCLPWQVLTMRMAERGWEGGTHPNFPYTVSALLEFLQLFPQILGPVLLGIMVIGIAACLVVPVARRSVRPEWATLFALLVAVWVFHSIVPAGVEDRKLIIAVPAMLMFALGGAAWIADRVPSHVSLYRWRYAAAAIATMSFFVTTFQVPRVEHYGFTEAATFLANVAKPSNATILVSSDSGGEGMLISEVAMLHPHPVETVLRGTKSLATVDWNGADYHCTYSSPAELLHFLRDEKVGYVVIDNFPPQVKFTHDALLKKTIATGKAFELIRTFRSRQSSMPGEIRIYRFAL